MKIIYIISAGRSGSTILDIILGNGEGVTSCGELNRYAEKKGMPTYWNSFEESPTFLFWNNIRSRLLEKLDSDFNFSHLSKVVKKYEYHYGIFNNACHGSSWFLYKRFNLSLYETIFENIENSVIVDSSKYPLRAWRLSKMSPFEIDYIYLKRDPRGVVKSFANKDVPQPSKSWLNANIYYFIVNALCQIVVSKLRRGHKVVEVKYEDIVETPVESLCMIQERLNINLEPAINKVKDGLSLSVGPLFAGNRIRSKNSIKLETKFSQYPNSAINFMTKTVNSFFYR